MDGITKNFDNNSKQCKSQLLDVFKEKKKKRYLGSTYKDRFEKSKMCPGIYI